MCEVVVSTCSRVGVTEELNGLTLENVLMEHIVEGLVDGEYQGDDAVTTVSCLERVTIDTCLGVGVVLEGIGATLAHAVTDGVKYLLVDVDPDTVEELLSVDGRIVTIETRTEVLLLITVPTVVPENGNIVSADGDDCIYERMNNKLEYGSTVTTLRRMCEVVVGTCSRVGVTEELNGLTLENVLMEHIVEGLVDGKYQGDDAVTAVSCLERVTVNTSFGVGVVLEGISVLKETTNSLSLHYEKKSNCEERQDI